MSNDGAEAVLCALCEVIDGGVRGVRRECQGQLRGVPFSGILWSDFLFRSAVFLASYRRGSAGSARLVGAWRRGSLESPSGSVSSVYSSEIEQRGRESWSRNPPRVEPRNAGRSTVHLEAGAQQDTGRPARHQQRREWAYFWASSMLQGHLLQMGTPRGYYVAWRPWRAERDGHRQKGNINNGWAGAIG